MQSDIPTFPNFLVHTSWRENLQQECPPSGIRGAKPSSLPSICRVILLPQLMPFALQLTENNKKVFSQFSRPEVGNQDISRAALPLKTLRQGCQTHFHQGPHQPHGCLQRVECNFNSLTVKEQLHLYSPLLFQPFEGNCEADVASGENEFDTPVLHGCFVLPYVPYH